MSRPDKCSMCKQTFHCDQNDTGDWLLDQCWLALAAFSSMRYWTTYLLVYIIIHPSEKAIPESNEVINLIGIPMNTYKKATTVEGNGSILEVYWDSDWNEVRINANIPMGNSIINLL